MADSSVILADDAARRLRGEACANCANYSSLAGCWPVQQRVETSGPFAGALLGETGGWCEDWSLAPAGMTASVGKALDLLAQNFGITRQSQEDDDSLRARINALYA